MSSFAEIAPICDIKEFSITEFIQQGGAGKVYSGIWKSSLPYKKVALKYFGYTEREPNEQQIYEEIDLMQKLRGIEGIVQLQAIFMDSPRGMVSGKYYKRSYPVIVMELLEGGELFEKIESTGAISENDLALLFRGIILALDSMHQRRYLHRDVKLENLMLVNKEPNSPVKIIDFGMMVRLKKGKKIYRSPTIQGTAGYVAPESLLYAIYSSASDIWQAGICLYSMLSGFAPFHPKHPEQITDHTYFPMVGLGWDGISDAAKDLVSKILVKNPDERITAAEILQHPWVTTEKASKNVLGSDYSLRIKHLGIRQKMKTFFVENNIQDHRLKRNHVKLLVPFLQEPQESNDIIVSTSDEESSTLYDSLHDLSFIRSSSTDSTYSQEEFSGKLKTLKSVVIQKIVDRNDVNFLPEISISNSPINYPQLLELSFDPEDHIHNIPCISLSSSLETDDNNNINYLNGLITTTTTTTTTTNGIENGTILSNGQCWEIDYFTFLNVMCESGLEELANPQVFGIFDTKATGRVNIKDFLFTMLAFRPDDTFDDIDDESNESAKLFFSLFDLNDCGYIGMDELKIVIGCLLQDETIPISLNTSEWNGPVNYNIEDLFHAIDINHDGKIDYEEFKAFYETILLHSTTRHSLSFLGKNQSKDFPSRMCSISPSTIYEQET